MRRLHFPALVRWKLEPEVALLSALLFALLPVNTESVVWSVGPPQAAVFELAAFCLFIERPKGNWRGLVWPVVLFAAAAFSHESAFIFPVLIAAYVLLVNAGAKVHQQDGVKVHQGAGGFWPLAGGERGDLPPRLCVANCYFFQNQEFATHNQFIFETLFARMTA